jgi:hypothetical protein
VVPFHSGLINAVELSWLRPLFFDPADEKSRRREIAAANAMAAPNRRLLCATCRHVVTDQRQRIAVQGGHEHTFANPHGITYRIGCFRDAHGCAVVGEALAEFTWFPGYAWRVGLCTNCQTHLGWRFESRQDYFHGLVLNRLTLEGPTASEPTEGI